MNSSSILIKIRKIVRSINIESKKIQKDYGLSIPQLLCLEYLRKSDNFQSTQKNIRDYLNLNSSTVTGIISRLEKKGCVARLPKKDDKRTTYIVLTSKGSELLDKTPPLLHERLSKQLETVSGQRQKEINDALDLIIKYLDIEGVDASPLITVDENIHYETHM
ncbi:MAG: MarR family winged helix-turn-helix transcriptional regulator [Thiohalospira sp.]